MRLFALRGANSVERNEADAILDATDALMRELMERNALTPDAFVSCIFTLTDDLNAEFPAVAARRHGLRPRAADVRPGGPGAGLDAAGDPRARALLRAARSTSRGTSTSARRARCAPISNRHNEALMALEFSERIRRIPVIRSPRAMTWAPTSRCSPPTSRRSRPLESVVAAATRVICGAHRYPDPSYSELRRALAGRYGVPAERIALGQGSCDILLAAGEALLEPGAEVVYAWPAFSVYPHLAAASGATAIQVPLDAEERHDLDAMAAEVTVATRLVLLCNPNNPTSTALDLDAITAFLDRIPPHVCVILDEAYCEFALSLGDTYASVELLRRYPNLVLLRTFSKVYGLAGLRVGYALCASEDFRVAVDQVRQPFYLSAAAQAAAVEALRWQDEVERRVVQTIASRGSLVDDVRRARAVGRRVRRELHLAAAPRGGRGGRRPLRTARPWRARPRRSLPRARERAPGHGRHRPRERAVRRRPRRTHSLSRRAVRRPPPAESSRSSGRRFIRATDRHKLPRGGRRRAGCTDAPIGPGKRPTPTVEGPPSGCFPGAAGTVEAQDPANPVTSPARASPRGLVQYQADAYERPGPQLHYRLVLLRALLLLAI